MAPNWIQIRVDLLEGRGEMLDPPPGRVLAVGPGQTFADLAASIDIAFARWDPAHLHEFLLPDGRRIGYSDPEAPEVLDHEWFNVTGNVRAGDVFAYVFDLGDEWRHRCEVLPGSIDPLEVIGEEPPPAPVPIMGWGTIPDQYGYDEFDPDALV